MFQAKNINFQKYFFGSELSTVREEKKKRKNADGGARKIN